MNSINKCIDAFILGWLAMGVAYAQPSSETTVPATPPKIHMVYFGGNDCPPCVQWRATQLPKLQQMNAFKSITFTHVEKKIKAPIPPSIFMPDNVKPYKEQLDQGGGGMDGSPQTAIMVNGKLYDYYFGARNAEAVEGMLLSIQNGTPYPYDRCLKRERSRTCLGVVPKSSS